MALVPSGEELAVFAIAVILGSMVFFSFVMAPLIFMKLPADISGPFIRQVFPVYYLVLGALSGLTGGALMLTTHRFDAGVLLAVSAVFFLARQILMPRINLLRDRQLREEPGSQSNAFSTLHRLSVVLNYLQMVAITTVLVRFVG